MTHAVLQRISSLAEAICAVIERDCRDICRRRDEVANLVAISAPRRTKAIRYVRLVSGLDGTFVVIDQYHNRAQRECAHLWA